MSRGAPPAVVAPAVLPVLAPRMLSVARATSDAPAEVAPPGFLLGFTGGIAAAFAPGCCASRDVTCCAAAAPRAWPPRVWLLLVPVVWMLAV